MYGKRSLLLSTVIALSGGFCAIYGGGWRKWCEYYQCLVELEALYRHNIAQIFRLKIEEVACESRCM